MAKDGTARGGVRVRSGKKPTTKSKIKVLNANLHDVNDLPSPDEIEGIDVPPIKEFLKAKQKNGKDLIAEDIYKQTYAWLKKRGCEKLVSVQLLEQYAMSVARWIQTEDAISEYGMLAKNPTTGNDGFQTEIRSVISISVQTTNNKYEIRRCVLLEFVFTCCS